MKVSVTIDGREVVEVEAPKPPIPAEKRILSETQVRNAIRKHVPMVAIENEKIYLDAVCEELGFYGVVR